MKNASAASCKLGYRVYGRAKSTGTPVTRETLNLTLVRGGYDAVSQRTWDNYVEQHQAGIAPLDYISINRWDYFHRKDGVPGQFVDTSEPSEPVSM